MYPFSTPSTQRDPNLLKSELLRYLLLWLSLSLALFLISLQIQIMKRKWEEDDDPQGENFSNNNNNSPPDIELHLETPLPLDWQRCLDIQSGQIHFYNTKTQKRTSVDPRRKLEECPNYYSPAGGGDHHPLSLDLELNLNCQSIRDNVGGQSKKNKSDINNAAAGLGIRAAQYGCCPPWLRLERSSGQQEMVARVCMQCHLLVMLLKSSPTCPNCKFIHPTDLQPTTTTTLFIASKNNQQTQCLNAFVPNPIQNKV